jgi:phosphate transport system protein
MSSTRQIFDQALEEHQQAVLRMGGLVEQSIYKAVHSLASQSLEEAQEVINGDILIDEMEREIEDRCLKLIATQQPIASDLRKISTGFKIIADLERMADLAVDIARVTILLSGELLIKPLVDIPRMAALVQQMVKDSLDAYVRGDAGLAGKFNEKDDEIDYLYNQIFRELLAFMMQDGSTITQAMYLLLVGRYIERIADHATNIAERAFFMVTGEHPVKLSKIITCP